MILNFLCCMTTNKQKKVIHCQNMYHTNSTSLNSEVVKKQLNQNNSVVTITSTLDELSNVICLSVKYKEQIRSSNILYSLRQLAQSTNTEIQNKSLEVLAQLTSLHVIKSDLAHPSFLDFLKAIIKNISHKNREEAATLYSKVISSATFSQSQFQEEINTIKGYLSDRNDNIRNAALSSLKSCFQDKKVSYDCFSKHNIQSQLIPLLNHSYAEIKLNTLDILNVFIKNEYLKEYILKNVTLNTLLSLFEDVDCKHSVLEFSHNAILENIITPSSDKNCKLQLCLIESLTDDRDDIRMSALTCLINYSKNSFGYQWRIIGAILPLVADTSDKIRESAISKIKDDFTQDEVKQHFRDSVIINESYGVCHYLADTYVNQGTALIPENNIDKALNLQRVFEIENLYSKLIDLARYYWGKRPYYTDDIVLEKKQELRQELTRWENYLKEPYLVSHHFSLADVCFFPVVAYMFRIGITPQSYPNLKLYYEKCMRRESIQQTWPPHWKDSKGKALLADV